MGTFGKLLAHQFLSTRGNVTMPSINHPKCWDLCSSVCGMNGCWGTNMYNPVWWIFAAGYALFSYVTYTKFQTPGWAIEYYRQQEHELAVLLAQQELHVIRCKTSSTLTWIQ